ncbi:immunity protein YezG family protein [Clostridium sp. YIM B02555]|uniref:immunity protein YezG family protein n=1 Tax=Clostridium sp. YIM B02555 TaxID=2911968 RepID=UPI001EEF57C6|nr:immunity protein YezG family protein [Clostridium sp. YIM B02555]
MILNNNCVNEIYEKIATKLDEIIPVEWEKIILYSEVTEDLIISYFYFYENTKNEPVYSLDIDEKYDLDDEGIEELSDELDEYLRELWNVFSLEKQQQWTNLTLYLNNKGEFNIDYDYSDLSSSDPYKQHLIWRYEKLGLYPENNRERDIKIIEDYIKNKN